MSSPQRSDIQVLRGFAVLLVLFYHADLISLPQGFLGVDIFFVISGYLITGMVAKDFSQGRFSFAGFYFRRAKRLLPAAYPP
ncbi:MAG TPA: acyltransferase [Thiobacillaceae bacterium]|nr:acyltransferase [Thiobacillaceae bacterium]